MKVTIDVPEELYRRVKARAALLGRPVREVTIELYRRWLGESPEAEIPISAEQWLDEWEALGESLLEGADGSTAREILAPDRNRLEPR